MKPRDLAMLYMRKAGQDELIAQKLAPMNDVADTGVGFHAQQAVEKYFKAVLALNEVNVRKTHDIGALLGQLQELDLDVPKELDEAVELTAYSVMARYPLDRDVEPLDRESALRLVSQVRDWAETTVGNA